METENSAAETMISWTPTPGNPSTHAQLDDTDADCNNLLPPPYTPPSQHHSSYLPSYSCFNDDSSTTDVLQDSSPEKDTPTSSSVNSDNKPTHTKENVLLQDPSRTPTSNNSARYSRNQTSPSASNSEHERDTVDDGKGSSLRNPSAQDGAMKPPSSTMDWKTGFLPSSSNKETTTEETLDMASLSDESTPGKNRHPGQTQYPPHTHEIQDLGASNFVDQNIHEEDDDDFRNPMLESFRPTPPEPVDFSGDGGGSQNRSRGEEGGVEGRGERGGGPSLSLWSMSIIFLSPVVLLPLPLYINTPEAKCAYVIFVMALLWLTEAIPIAVTSFLPVVMFPMMGLMTARHTAALYVNNTSMLCLGGILVALAIERWQLHKRMTLTVIRAVGTEPKWLMLGVMGVTWGLSMWMSNTATTAMMLPLAQAILQHLYPAPPPPPPKGGTLPLPPSAPPSSQPQHDPPIEDGNDQEAFIIKEAGESTSEGGRPREKQTREEEEEGRRREEAERYRRSLGKALSLAVAYSANVGGIACLTGTAPNLILLGHSQIVFEKVGLDSPITFGNWMVYGVPLSFLLLLTAWLWLYIFYLRCPPGCRRSLRQTTDGRSTDDTSRRKLRDVIREDFRKLGSITYAEGTVMACFVILVVLWITRDLGRSGGWGNLFPSWYVSDATPAMLMGILMFVLPSARPDVLFRSRLRGRKGGGGGHTVTPLLTWETVNSKMPWSLFWLLGGGFAIAKATQESGLSEWLGQQLSVLGSLDPWLMLLIVCYVVSFTTEVTSNGAIATIIMPIMAQLGVTLKQSPLFFMFPAAYACSFAFMLPVATPPNAIAFAYGTLRVVDMMTCGIVLNLVSVPILLLATVTWGNAFFHFDVMPPEFSANVTTFLNVTTG